MISKLDQLDSYFLFFSFLQTKLIFNKMVSIKIGDYLIKRLKEVGIDTVFGVPGDYNMVS